MSCLIVVLTLLLLFPSLIECQLSIYWLEIANTPQFYLVQLQRADGDNKQWR